MLAETEVNHPRITAKANPCANQKNSPTGMMVSMTKIAVPHVHFAEMLRRAWRTLQGFSEQCISKGRRLLRRKGCYLEVYTVMLAPGAQLPPGTSTRCTVADTSPLSNSPFTPCHTA